MSFKLMCFYKNQSQFIKHIAYSLKSMCTTLKMHLHNVNVTRKIHVM